MSQTAACGAPPEADRPALSDADERRVARQVAQLRACANAGDYRSLQEDLVRKRLAWWKTHGRGPDLRGPLPRRAYTLVLLDYMGLDPGKVPVVHEDDRKIVWRSTNFCPTLEACSRLGLDTRVICRAATEGPVQALIACLDPHLCFSRNYTSGIRPYAPFCEEMIELLRF